MFGAGGSLQRLNRARSSRSAISATARRNADLRNLALAGEGAQCGEASGGVRITRPVLYRFRVGVANTSGLTTLIGVPAASALI